MGLFTEIAVPLEKQLKAAKVYRPQSFNRQTILYCPRIQFRIKSLTGKVQVEFRTWENDETYLIRAMALADPLLTTDTIAC